MSEGRKRWVSQLNGEQLTLPLSFCPVGALNRVEGARPINFTQFTNSNAH